MGKRSISRPPFWILAREDQSEADPLTMSISGEEVPAVFCAREEAEMYLRLGNGHNGKWRPTEIEDAALLSLLTEQWRRVKSIALDPLPEGVGLGLSHNLYSTSRISFITMLNFRLARDGQRVRTTGLFRHDIGKIHDTESDKDRR